MIRNGKEGGLGVHRNVPYEFVITLSRWVQAMHFLPRSLKLCDRPPLGVLIHKR